MTLRSWAWTRGAVLGTLVAVALLRALSTAAEAFAWSALSTAIVERRRLRAASLVLALPLPALESLGPGGAVARILDAPAVVAQGCVSVCTALLRDGVSVVVLSAAALFLRPALFGVVLLVWALVLSLLRTGARRQDQGASRARRLWDRVASWAAALPSVAPVVTAHGAREAVLSGLAGTVRALGAEERRRHWLSALSSPAAELLGALSVVAVLGALGPPEPRTLDATLGFFYVVFLAWRSLRSLGGVQLQAANGASALVDLAALEALACNPAAVRVEDAVVIQGLSVLRGQRRPVEGLSLRLEPGGLVVLAGPSGVGKTSALDAVVGLRPAEGGLREPPLGSVLGCGLATQPPPLLPASLALNLLLGRPPTSRMNEVLAALELQPWVLGLPEGLQTEVGPGGILPSTGQVQRLGVARAVLHPGPLVVLDEPTAGLDRPLAERVVDLLVGEARRGRMVLVASHDPALLGRADRVITLGAAQTER
ncbi:MAG: ABC transporter ATP-binding protein [Deltaproteobacteria bacterium]|nr:ABC transporter ATP-binding protein [Deltaproteobacteria bacterium]